MFVFGREAEADIEQADGAVGGVRADLLVREWRQAMPTALFVERVAQVRRGVGERAVEVEQDCLDHRVLQASRRQARM